MTFFELIEVGIGVIFVWLLLSLASMTIQEWLAGQLKLRAKDLETQIRLILDDPDEAWINKDGWLNQVMRGIVTWIRRILKREPTTSISRGRYSLAEAFYQHPLIKTLSKEGEKPSYIPDRTFSLALLDVMMNASSNSLILVERLDNWEKQVDGLKLPTKTMAAIEIQLLDLKQLIEAYTGQPEFRSIVSHQLDSMVTELRGMNTKLDSLLDELYDLVPEIIQVDVRKVLNSIRYFWQIYPEVARVLNSFLPDAYDISQPTDEFFEKIRSKLETWFNDSMERLSGWYKRRAQLIGALLGFILAVVFNVDTISITDALWREPIVRETLVARAEAFEIPEVGGDTGVGEMGPEEAWDNFYRQFEGMSLPLGWDYDDGVCLSPSGEKLGFRNLAFSINRQCYRPVDMPVEPVDSLNLLGVKLFGWIVSAVASGQGATYWFDILKRLVNVRSTGKNPAEETKKS